MTLLQSLEGAAEGRRRRVINLRDLGFVYRVSDEARAEIEANERRAMRVLTTAHLYWFGRRS